MYGETEEYRQLASSSRGMATRRDLSHNAGGRDEALIAAESDYEHGEAKLGGIMKRSFAIAVAACVTQEKDR